jgi:hypothetical protein
MKLCGAKRVGLPAAWLALGWVACFPQAVDPLGHPCDDAHLCPSPLVCVANVCAPAVENTDGGGTDAGNPTDAGARVNIMTDGDFEAGPVVSLQYWHGDSLQIQTARVRSGNYAAQVSRNGSTTLATWPVEAIPLGPGSPGGLYCAEAWVTSDQPALPFVQLVRTAFDTSQIPSGAMPFSTVALDGGADWLSIRSSITRVSSDLALNLSVTTPLTSGSLYVDDVSVWASPDGTCSP